MKAKSLGPTLRLKSRNRTASKPYARLRLAGKSEDSRRKPKGPLMQLKLQWLSLVVLPVEANRLKLPTPVAGALRRKPPKSKEELEE